MTIICKSPTVNVLSPLSLSLNCPSMHLPMVCLEYCLTIQLHSAGIAI